MTIRPKPTISPEEMQRRRGHVRVAIADNRIEGLPPPSREEQEILDAYIRGEIEAGDLVAASLKHVAAGPSKTGSHDRRSVA